MSSAGAASANNGGFSFPLLKYSEIVTSLTDGMDCPVSLEELTDPQELRFKQIYENLLEKLKGINVREELKNNPPAFAAMEIMSYPELHEDSLYEMGFLKELLELIKIAGVHDITVRDILMPEKQRTRRILSALINFARFREDKLEHFTHFTQESARLLEIRNKYEDQVNELTDGLDKIRLEHSQVAPQIDSLRAEVDTLKNTLSNQMQEQTTLREEVRAIKALSSDLAEEVQTISIQIIALQQENAKLKGQLIRSPEKLKRSILDMSNEMVEKRNTVEENSNKLRILSNKLQAINKIANKLSKRLVQLRDIQSDQQSLKKLTSSVKEQSTLLSETEEKNEELLQKSSKLNQDVEKMHEKLSKQQLDMEEKRKTAQEAIENLDKEKTEWARMYEQKKSKSEENENMLKLKKQQLLSLQTEHQRIMSSLKKKYLTLQQAVAAYHENLAQVMNHASAAVPHVQPSVLQIQ